MRGFGAFVPTMRAPGMLPPRDPDQTPPIIVIPTNGGDGGILNTPPVGAPTSNPTIPTGQDLVSQDRGAGGAGGFTPPSFIETFFQGPHILLAVAAGLGIYLLLTRKKH